MIIVDQNKSIGTGKAKLSLVLRSTVILSQRLLTYHSEKGSVAIEQE